MPAHSVSFLLDAPTGEPLPVIQIAKLGEGFRDARYGTFAITLAEVESWARNLALMPGGRACIDTDHKADKPGAARDTEAAGWITRIFMEDGVPKADVEWTPLGDAAIKDKRYLFFSPTYGTWTDEHGKDHPNTLIGGALTNRPFLNMPTVCLAAAPPVFAVEQAPEQPPAVAAADSRSATMPLPKNILSKLGLGEDATDEQALEAVIKLAARPEAQKTLDQLAVDSGKVVLDADAYAKTVADATAGAAAAKELHESKFESAFDAALTDDKGPRVTPAQKDGLKTLYDANADATLAAIAAMPSLGINVEGAGTRGDAPTVLDANAKRDADGDPVDVDRLALHNRTLQLSAEKNIDYGAALDLAAAELGA